ncbi:hypothetical protein LK08_00950 [Streptomyces sp. MUSC 125]|nr:hypothetical protein LK06_027700 [Streptomyces pluripotens]KIE28821.1 hypothetical protein LK08_00950 [Streptomyces sp. MUSC 125]
MVCCCGTEAPSHSQVMALRAPVSILSSCAGPHVVLSVSPRTLRDTATHSFHTHRHRAHSAIRPARAVDDMRSR